MDQSRLKTFSGRAGCWGALFFVLLAAAAWGRIAPSVQAQTPPARHAIAGFELFDADTGWVWHGGDLDWTDDGGLTWRRITPGVGERRRLAAVHFAGPGQGWALLQPTPTDAETGAVLAATEDAGATWRLQPLPPDLAATLQRAKSVYVLPLAAQVGWLAADLAQSSNFSRGRLWYTADGGASWQQRQLPVGEPPQFVNAVNGWLAGGPRGDALWRTQDGGVTWQQQPLPAVAGAEETIQVYAPIFSSGGQEAVLPLLLRSGAGQAVTWLVSADGGASWERSGQRAEVDPAQRWVTARAVDARAWLAAQTGKPILPPVQPLPYFANTLLEGGRSLIQVKAATAQSAWAVAEAGGRATNLLATSDGGTTWQPLTLPPATAPAQEPAPVQAGAAPALTPLAAGSRTAVMQGAGFDVCDLPTLSELAAWHAAGPYRIVNLYLGGSLRFCDNERLTADHIAQLSAQGWTFIPTWVGPQAPCSVYSRRFSSDPITAYAEGAAEAEAALAAAQKLGLSEADGSGTIIYYDLESFDTTGESCIAAVQAFVSGWTDRLHGAGSQSGLYGSACNPRIDRFALIASPPDAVWVAQWNRDAYDPDLSVWGIACLDNTLWSRSQRIRQYTGGHDETWGGVTLNIDSDVVDGLVADPGRSAPPTSTPTATPTSTPTPQPVVVVELPVVQPPVAGGMCASGWHPIDGGRGSPTYLAANRAANGTIPPASTPQAAQWNAAIPSSGDYQVEAWIAAHAAIAWQCPPAALSGDTATARYTVQHAQGEQMAIGNQAAAGGDWLPLGVYPFEVGTPITITLATATGEGANTRTVSAGALRLTRLAERQGTQFLYLPLVQRR